MLEDGGFVSFAFPDEMSEVIRLMAYFCLVVLEIAVRDPMDPLVLASGGVLYGHGGPHCSLTVGLHQVETGSQGPGSQQPKDLHKAPPS